MAKRQGFHSSNAGPKELPKAKLTKANIKQALKIFSYVKPYKWLFVGGMLALFGGSIMSLMVPYLFGKLIGTEGSEAGAIGSFNTFIQVDNVAPALIVVLLGMALLTFARVALLVRMGESALGDLRIDTFRHIIRLPMEFFTQTRVGELQSRISADLTQIQEVITSTLAEFTRQVIILVGGIAFLAWISLKLTLLMLAVFPILIIAAVIFGKYIRTFARKAQDKLAETTTVVEESLQAIATVKAYVGEWFELRRYKRHMSDVVKLASEGGVYRGLFAGFTILAFFGSIVSVVWYGTVLEEAGELNKESLVSFILYSVFVGGAMGGFAGLYARIQKAVGSTERVFEILTETIEPVKMEKPSGDFRAKGEITFNDVEFYYPSRPELTVLKKLNLSVSVGEKIALVGQSGAGKSTFVSLLLRYYDPKSGNIFLDGKDLKDYEISTLRHQIAIVPQDVVLFGGTIKENILYGDPDASDEQVIEAAKKANAHDFISSFPEAYETVVGERGIKLSGGQRQRVAIARAVLKDPAILLLDEATSSLDTESEKQVQEALDKLMLNRTSIIIAHRLSTIRDADRIAVLDAGEIKEIGTHDELLKLEKGLYKNLNNLQEAGAQLDL